MAYYFASDVHLGLSFQGEDPRVRERKFVAWLERIAGDCEGLFLVGDIFDFWFEYKRVIPKGSERTLGKLAELTDRGIPVYFFVGNHDYWVGDYFEREIGMKVYLKPEVFELNGKRIFVAHGDGLGKVGDWKYKLMTSGFHSRWLRRVASILIHPNVMMRFGAWWSSKSRHGRKEGVSHVFGGENEPIVRFARHYMAEHRQDEGSENEKGGAPDYFVCGHIHTPVDYALDNQSRVIILGEWIKRPVIGRLDEKGVITLEDSFV